LKVARKSHHRVTEAQRNEGEDGKGKREIGEMERITQGAEYAEGRGGLLTRVKTIASG
jgi:hypothetical protein